MTPDGGESTFMLTLWRHRTLPFVESSLFYNIETIMAIVMALDA